jgi:hypothetical protein
MESDYHGMYEYKGFTIWNSGNKQWIAEPDWSIEALEKLKSDLPRHQTIAKAKKWVRDEGIKLKEESYL